MRVSHIHSVMLVKKNNAICVSTEHRRVKEVVTA